MGIDHGGERGNAPATVCFGGAFLLLAGAPVQELSRGR
jgi:hypothetical protein